MEFLLGLLVITVFCAVILGTPLLIGAFPEYAIGAAVIVGLALLVVRVV